MLLTPPGTRGIVAHSSGNSGWTKGYDRGMSAAPEVRIVDTGEALAEAAAREMLAAYGSLADVAGRELAELARMPGVGRAKAARLRLLSTLIEPLEGD
mgnify:CR=1 FL=1